MGADLYIHKLYDRNSKKYQALFDHAINKRNASTDKTAQHFWQAKATSYYNKMYEFGYFRDSYNDSSIFQQLGLSWWRDVIPMLNKKRELTPEASQKLLGMIETRKELFNENINKLTPHEKETRVQVIEYFTQKYFTLTEFLKEAIRQKLPIDCSL